MKQQWQRLAAKLDARNQRERGLLSAMVLVVVASLLNALLIDPLLAKKKTSVQEIATQQAELQTLQTQISTLEHAGMVDPDAATRVKMENLRQKLELNHAALQSVQQGLVPPEKMGSMLADVLTQNRGLQLVSLKTLPVESVLDVAASAPAAATPPKEKKAETPTPGIPSIYKHGVEIAVSGDYAELTRYLGDLEQLPWRMFWGKAEMRVEKYPQITLTITLYTLSMDKTWMAI